MNTCSNLANLYINHDLGNPDDVARAISQLEASEFDENGRNAYFVGLAYATGRGKPEDKDKALSFFYKSCDAGMAEACSELEAIGN